MTTPDLRTASASNESPLSTAELSTLASQIYAQLSGVSAGGGADGLSAGLPDAPTGPPASLPLPGSLPVPGGALPGIPFPGSLLPGQVPEASSVPQGFPGADVAGAGLPTAQPASLPSPGSVPVPGGGIPGFPGLPGLDGVPGLDGLPPAGVPTFGEGGVPTGAAPSGGVSSVPASPGVSAPSVPSQAAFQSFALPDSSLWLPSSPVGDLPWGAPTGGAKPAEPDYYELGEPSRSGGIRHQVLEDPRSAGRDGQTVEVFDVEHLRRDFPILSERVNGHQLVWLDNAATTHKPEAVIERIGTFYRHENSNIHRAAHELAARATNAYEDARETVRRFIGASRTEEIIFVRGTTEAINLVAQAWGGKFIGPGDEIVITHLEHHANIVPWQLLAQRTGAVIKVAPVDDAGTLLLPQFEALLGPRTKLVSATHVSNALGTVNPVEKIVELGHRYGARVLIDAAQSVPHLRLDVAKLGADFVVFSGHKIFGPTGIGVLYGREEVLAETPPWQSGGNMIADVTLERSIFQGPPNKFEAGTGNIADAVGLGAALRYVERVGIERIAAYEHSLLEYATPLLAAIPGVRLVGTSPEKASVRSFVLAGHETITVGQRLNEVGIAVRAGHHCAQPILRRLGLEATVRPSFAFYNTYDEADQLADAVRWIAANPI